MIVNPVAGGGRGKRVWQTVESLLRSRFSNLQARLTTARGDAEGLAAEYARTRPDGLLIVVGGDGSIHEILNGLLDAGYAGTLAIVPAGTGNDVARNLHIPLDPGSAARFHPARVHPVDVGRVAVGGPHPGHRWFLNSFSVGTSARANRIARSIGRVLRGPVKYPVAGALALFSSRAAFYEVLVAGHSRYRGRAINLTIANGACFGGGLQISPQSLPDDGLLDLVIIGDMGRIRAMTALRALRSGGHVAMREVEVVPKVATPIEIHARGELRFETDGENLVAYDHVIVNLEPKRLRVAR